MTTIVAVLVGLPLPTGMPSGQPTPTPGPQPSATAAAPALHPRPTVLVPPACATDMAAGDLVRSGAVGAAAVGASATLCSPLGVAAALPASELEAEDPEMLYALVTRERAVEPVDYAPDDLRQIDGGPYRARAEVVRQLDALRAAAADAGLAPIRTTSGFRDHDTQAGTYQDWVRRAGAARAERVSARPGHSEHQLGLAVDITGPCGGFACFAGTPEAQWVAENAHRFGFIVRYPDGGTRVTGYAPEAWHLRYVGPRAAWAMHLQGERYWDRFAEVALEAAQG